MVAHFLLTTHWSRGDVQPFLLIGKKLRERGHQVTLFSHNIYKKEAEENGLNFIAWETPDEWGQAPLLSSWVPVPSLNSYFDCQQVFETYFNIPRYKSELEKLAPYARQADAVFIVRYSSSVSAMIAAELYNVPIIPIFITPSYLNQVGLDHDIFGATYTAHVNLLRADLGLPPIPDWSGWTCQPHVHLGLWPRWFFRESTPWIKNLIPVGFPNYNDDIDTDFSLSAELKAFLSGGEPPVVVSGSSGRDTTITYFPEAIEACHDLGLRTILVTPHEELVPDNMTEAMHWERFANFDALLSQARAIIHHGGIGTICCAIRASTPQLLLANNVDRPFNAVHVQRLGIGKFLPVSQWSKNKIKEGLADLLATAVREKCAYYSKMIVNERSMDTVCGIAENAVRNQLFKLAPASSKVVMMEKKNVTAQAVTAQEENSTGSSPGKKDHLRRLLHERLKKQSKST